MALLLVTTWLGYYTQQDDFKHILIGISAFWLSLYVVYQKVHSESEIYFFAFIGILLRIALIPAFPNWSDDIYRFLWDGYLWNAGINPFDHLPTYYMENNSSIPGITQDLFNELNSPGYFTIYPPVCQAVFGFATWLFPSSWYAAMIVMKLLVVGFEVGSIGLLILLLGSGFFSESTQIKPVLLYALNPLIVFEISGNLHFEGPMIFFLLSAFWFLKKGWIKLSAVAWAFSIASKLLPLLFLPFLIRRLGLKKSLFYFGVIGFSLLLLFLPIFNYGFLENFGSSIDLYFRKFEFNASIYYLLRWLGFQFVGYNLIQQIGPLLALSVFIITWIMVYKEKRLDWSNLPISLLWSIMLYLVLATTVHPWYVILPVTLCLFTNYRFPILWSGLVLLTYVNYSYSEYQENLWVVAGEYGILLVYIFYEVSKKIKRFSRQNQ